MLKKYVLSVKYLLVIIVFSVFLTIIHSNKNFSAGDDDNYLRWARSNKSFLTIFSPKKAMPMDSYRPVANNLYWLVCLKLFKEKAFFYEIVLNLFWLGCMFFIYKLVTLCKNRTAGFITAILLMFTPPVQSLLDFFALSTSSIFGFFFTLASLFCIIKGLILNKKKYLVGGILLAILAILSRESSSYIIGICVILYIALCHKHLWQNDIKLLIVFSILCIFSFFLFSKVSNYPAAKNIFLYFGLRIKSYISMLTPESFSLVSFIPVFLYGFYRMFQKNTGFLKFSFFWFIFSFIPILFFELPRSRYLVEPLAPLTIFLSISLSELIAKKNVSVNILITGALLLQVYTILNYTLPVLF